MVLGSSAAPCIAETSPPAPVVGAESSAVTHGATEGSVLTAIVPPPQLELSTVLPETESMTDTDTPAEGMAT